ncbi:hypothetical protein GCM10010423_69000 [Streptomyces levis]|uniref:Uncharacterized protein n=1 Tax=Streptomyces levis TaxID=285566 RepID=A0ABN3P7M2_9ACTN
MPKKQSTAAQRAREAARRGGKYSQALRTADAPAVGVTEPDNRSPAARSSPAPPSSPHPSMPWSSLATAALQFRPVRCTPPGCWTLSLVPPSRPAPTPGSPPGSASASTSDWCDAWARSLTEEHEQVHDGAWACCLLCNPGRLPS